MSDEIHDEIEIDDAALEDDDAEVEGHVMFAEKKGFSLKPDLFAPPCEPQLDDWERGGYSGNTNEPVLGDDEIDDDDAEVEGHVMFAAKKGFGLNPGLIPPPCEPQLDDWERSAGLPDNTNEPVLDDVV